MSKLKNPKLPMPVVLSVITMSMACAVFAERIAYETPPPRPPVQKSCISCHKDKKALKAIAEKSNDPLYLVHVGELSKAQLNELLNQKSEPASAKSY